MSVKRWFGIVGVLVLAACLLAAGFNFIVDPWSLNETVSIAGFNERKPDPIGVARLHKAYAAMRLKPAAVAIGSSSAEHGINMRHPAWDGHAPAYNMSFAGATIIEIKTFLLEVHKSVPLRRVTIGLDLFAFNAHREPSAQTGEALAAMRNPLQRVRPYFTRGMLTASFGTILRQPELFAYFTASGQSNAEAYEVWRAKLKGHHNLFIYSSQDTVRDLLPGPAHRFELQRGAQASTLDQFRELLDFAHRENIELQLFVSPYHAWTLETVRALGLWPIFEYWKQQLAHVVSPYADKSRIALWDFADYSVITAEDVPPRNDAEAVMRWFWDARHYKVELGNLIQDRMSGSTASAEKLPEGYGVRLDAQNVGEHLLAVRERQKQYQDSHPRDVAAIEVIAARTLASLRSAR